MRECWGTAIVPQHRCFKALANTLKQFFYKFPILMSITCVELNAGTFNFVSNCDLSILHIITKFLAIIAHF
ncbi:hypothetical protein M529_01180 [Sphingobium ummariense RL-3]|uniref:Uncharacterized protein n=1 Tax=Sphingobium ummariense RL-3 TaxID=1346791 RepID=T0IYT4_9SPHN|nr:hypothetical protein M529_01180 [Sphingobium ummariense RL-3]